MYKFLISFVWLSFIALINPLAASMPVSVKIAGCIENGYLMSYETDFGTHKVERRYPIRINVINKDRKSINISSFNGKRVSIKGYIIPGDHLYPDMNSIKVIGDCVKQSSGSKRKKLPLHEQEKLAKELFQEMAKTDSDKTDVFIKLYGRVIDECPDTEKAQEAYWRLSNLYLYALDKPDYMKIIALLEKAVKRYPNTAATPHYKKRLLLAYEETKQWQKAVGIYEEEIKTNPEILREPENAATMIAYADALIGIGNKAKARDILRRVVDFGDKIEDWLVEIAKVKLEGMR